MSIVLPGMEEVMAMLLPDNMLIKLDLPTFDRPIKAYSGKSPDGHFSTSELLTTKSALLIIITIHLIRCKHT